MYWNVIINHTLPAILNTPAKSTICIKIKRIRFPTAILFKALLRRED